MLTTAGNNHDRSGGQRPAMMPNRDCDPPLIPGQFRRRGEPRENALLQAFPRLDGCERSQRALNLRRVVDG